MDFNGSVRVRCSGIVYQHGDVMSPLSLSAQETDVSASDDDKSEQSYLLASSRPLLNHPLLFPPTSYQPYQDKTVPFPRTSGARFGGSGIEVFTWLRLDYLLVRPYILHQCDV